MDMSLSKLRETVKDREAWHAAVHRVAKRWTRLWNWKTKATQKTYAWNLENWYRWTYLQGRNRDTDLENRVMYTRWGGGKERVGWIERIGLINIYTCYLMLSRVCNPMDCSPQGSPVRGISQPSILEWVTISISRGFLNPGIENASLALAGRFFIAESLGNV